MPTQSVLKKPPKVGLKYLINDGPYKGRLCKVIEFLKREYLVHVEILGPWGESTGQNVHVTTVHMEI